MNDIIRDFSYQGHNSSSSTTRNTLKGIHRQKHTERKNTLSHPLRIIWKPTASAPTNRQLAVAVILNCSHKNRVSGFQVHTPNLVAFHLVGVANNFYIPPPTTTPLLKARSSLCWKNPAGLTPLLLSRMIMVTNRFVRSLVCRNY